MASPGQEFKPSAPKDEPLTTKGHQVGQMVGDDAVPEFHAQTVPAGSAPKKDTYTANPDMSGNAESAEASAQDTITGATSGEVHTGIGHPGSNQTRQESHDAAAGSGSTEGLGRTGLAMAEGEKESAEAKALKSERNGGPSAAQEHNSTVAGSEGIEGMT